MDVQYLPLYGGDDEQQGETTVTQNQSEVDTEDAEAIAASDAALRDFAMELNRLHIAFGAPSYEVITKASVRPRLTKAGINEALSGKRLPSIDSLLEFVRVVSNPLPPPADAPAPRCRPDLADAWRARWQEVKFTQRRAQAPWRRLRSTMRDALDEAAREAEAVRAAAREEATQILGEASEEKERLRAEAEVRLAAAGQELIDAREQAARICREASEEAEQLRAEAAERNRTVPQLAGMDTQELIAVAGLLLVEANPAFMAKQQLRLGLQGLRLEANAQKLPAEAQRLIAEAADEVNRVYQDQMAVQLGLKWAEVAAQEPGDKRVEEWGRLVRVVFGAQEKLQEGDDELMRLQEQFDAFQERWPDLLPRAIRRLGRPIRRTR